MAHFQKGGNRISGSTIPLATGSYLDFSLWGPLNTYLPGNPELHVALKEPVSAGKFARGEMKNNARIWRISMFPPGKWTIVAKTDAEEVWDSFTIEVKKAAPKADPVSSPIGGVTWDYLFGAPYSGATVDLNTKRRPTFFPCRMVASLKTAMQGNAVKAKQLGDWGLGTVTPHTAGAALDISYLNKGQSLAYANGLLKLFIQHRTAMQWGFISFNRMHFSQANVASAAGDHEHDDHIHIDWLDYGRTQYATTPPSFQYYSDRNFEKDAKGKPTKQGVLMTKTLTGKGQPVAMYWAPGASAGSIAEFTASLAQYNREFPQQQSQLEAMKLNDFEALYRPAAVQGFMAPSGPTGLRSLHFMPPRFMTARR